MSKKLNKKGFTLIEVVLVLAIGGLIFLLAFIAFQNAQTNRRDSQRRTALDTMAAEIQNYSGDKNGALPSSYSDLGPYLSALKDPKDRPYVALATGSIADAAPSTVSYQKGTASGITSCKNVANAIKANDYKIEMRLEKGVACRDSL